MKTFKLNIYAADKTFFTGDAVSLVVPLSEGQYGIMAHHSNLIGALIPGKLKFTTEDGKEHYAAVSGGLVKAEKGEVLILSETIEAPEEIDAKRAEQDLQRAREEILHKQSLREHKDAERKIAKALSRLRVKKFETKN